MAPHSTEWHGTTRARHDTAGAWHGTACARSGMPWMTTARRRSESISGFSPLAMIPWAPCEAKQRNGPMVRDTG
eukprot:364750-Chlamydomonas_euryale.AAC.17